MSDYLDRVIAEKEALDEKINKLGNFLASGKIEPVAFEQHGLLLRQLETMQQYASILEQRLRENKS